MTTTPTIDEQVEAAGRAESYYRESMDSRPLVSNRAVPVETALRAATATLRTLQGDDEAMLERMARAHDASHLRLEWTRCDAALAEEWNSDSDGWQEWRMGRIDRMRAALHAITGEGE